MGSTGRSPLSIWDLGPPVPALRGSPAVPCLSHLRAFACADVCSTGSTCPSLLSAAPTPSLLCSWSSHPLTTLLNSPACGHVSPIGLWPRANSASVHRAWRVLDGVGARCPLPTGGMGQKGAGGSRQVTGQSPDLLSSLHEPLSLSSIFWKTRVRLLTSPTASSLVRPLLLGSSGGTASPRGWPSFEVPPGTRLEQAS